MPRSAYTMKDYVWFKTPRVLPDCPTPFYLGRGAAHTTAYNSLTNPQPPMPNHGILKISLSPGGLFCQQSVTTEMEPGDATLRAFGETVMWDRYNPRHRGDWEFLGMIFRGEAAMTMLRDMTAEYGHLYRLALDSALIRHLLALADHPGHAVDMSIPEATRLVTDVLMSLVERADQAQVTPKGDQLARAVARFILENFEHDFSASELAERHGISREHLTRRFKQAMGVTPREFMIHEKMAEACRLLRHTQLPLKTIMRRLGYDSSSTFFRVFRQTVGTTPRSYRASRVVSGASHFTQEASDD